ncbi:MAG: ComEC/Rec2 family competence protein [Chthoniobacterales bacterium]
MRPLIARLCVLIGKRRYPFLGLALSAMLGILVAHGLSIPAIVYGALALVMGFGLFFFESSALCLALTFCVFASVFLWKTRESPQEVLASNFADQRVVVVMEGTVCEEPVVHDERVRLLFHADKVLQDGCPLVSPLNVVVFAKNISPGIGDRLKIVASLQRIPRARNPGEFDVRSWDWIRNIYFQATVSRPEDVITLGYGESNWLQREAVATREWIMKTLSNGIASDSEVSSTLQTIVLGNVAGTSEATEDAFRHTGTYHLFSVSGLHVAMLATIFWYILNTLRVPRRYAMIMIVPLLFGYAFLTGWKPSSIRAAVMAGIVLSGLIFSRRSLALNSLFGAAFLILIFDPRELFNPGFQLSFGVVASILLIVSPTQRLFRRQLEPDAFLPRQLVSRFERIVRWALCSVAGVICVSSAAWIGSLPFIAGYFHMLSLTSIPANLFAVPIAFIILSLAVVSMGCAVFSSWLSAVFNNANWVFVKLLLLGINTLSTVPGSYLKVKTWQWDPPLAEIVVFDLGAGGATLIHSGSAVYMVDCGGDSDVRWTILPYLNARGVSSLEWVALTHGDARHIGGIPRLMESLHVKDIIESGAEDHSRSHMTVDRYLNDHSTHEIHVGPDDVFKTEHGGVAKVLFPPVDNMRSRSDDKALVMRFKVGAVRILMMSDSGFFTEHSLLESKADIRADILIMGRHFTGMSGDPDFLAAVKPFIVITTVAQIPATEQLPEGLSESVDRIGAKLFRMDQTGAVRIRIFKNRYEVDSFLSDEHSTHRFDVGR